MSCEKLIICSVLVMSLAMGSLGLTRWPFPTTRRSTTESEPTRETEETTPLPDENELPVCDGFGEWTQYSKMSCSDCKSGLKAIAEAESGMLLEQELREKCDVLPNQERWICYNNIHSFAKFFKRGDYYNACKYILLCGSF